MKSNSCWSETTGIHDVFAIDFFSSMWEDSTVAEKDHDRKIIKVLEKVSDLLLDLTTRAARYITRAALVISRVPRLNI